MTCSTSDGRQVFIGITSDAHWQRFCEIAGRADLLADAGLATNNQRIAERARLMPELRAYFAGLTQEQAIGLAEEARIPFSPIAVPEDLFEDAHLAATGGLLPTRLPNGTETRLPRLPIRIGEESFGLKSDPPGEGADSRDVLRGLGIAPDRIAALIGAGIVVQGE